MTIRLDDVGFRYAGATENAITGVTMDVPIGKLTFVTGRLGAGCSTLLQILGGLVALGRMGQEPPNVWHGSQADDIERVQSRLADLVVRDGRDPRRHHHRSASALSIPAPQLAIASRSASMYKCVVSRRSCPSHSAMTLMSTPDCSRCIAVECLTT